MQRRAQAARTSCAKNAFGQVPVIEDGDVDAADSNAILVYLAARYDASGRWLPRDPLGAAQVQRWLSVAAGQLAYGPAAARAGDAVRRRARPRRACKAIAAQLLRACWKRTCRRARSSPADRPTIADVALYSYIAHAPEGGVSLEPYPQRARLAGAHRGAARLRADAAQRRPRRPRA